MDKKLWGTHQRQMVLAVFVLGSVLGCNVPQDEEGAEGELPEMAAIEQGIIFNGHDYLFVTTSKSWYDARTHCANQGYHLVTIDTPDEQTFLRNQQAAAGQSLWWIGFNDIEIEGVWKWEGVSSTTSYSNWAPGEPNNSKGAEDCTIDGWAGQWNDGRCGDWYPFVCEKTLPLENSFSYNASNTSSATINTYNHYVYLPAGRILTVGTCGVAGASGSGDTYLRLNNPSGQEIASNDDAGGSCGLLSNLSITTPSSGTYVIRAGCYSSGSCSGTVVFTY